jgi:hypothetical protein
LVASVLNSPAAQTGALMAALLNAYVAADTPVGLDVDKDAFDKYTMRAHIGMATHMGMWTLVGQVMPVCGRHAWKHVRPNTGTGRWDVVWNACGKRWH